MTVIVYQSGCISGRKYLEITAIEEKGIYTNLLRGKGIVTTYDSCNIVKMEVS